MWINLNGMCLLFGNRALMPSFRHDGIDIAFLDTGEDAGARAGEPIVLVHGFASNKEVNWVAPGWFTTLTRAGRRAIALDNRGHGASSKLYQLRQEQAKTITLPPLARC